MKVSGTGGPSAATGPLGARPQSAAGGFAPITTPAAPEPAGISGASSVAHVSSLEALIALQEVGGPLERRRRSVGRAGKILDALDALKLDLMDGRLSKSAVEALTRAVREQRALTDEPGLESLLDEIETRAAVELAKLERAAGAT
jgi:hypothetical protein